MRFGSVCSGIESASAAWKPLGWECAFVSEINKYCNQVLRHHYPDVPNYGDFTEIGEAEDIELLVAGTPCQDFSVAGLREGLAGDKGNLTLEFVRLLDRIQPTWLLWENVPGVLSSWSDAEEDPETGWITQTNDFDQFLAALSELGYEWAWRILDAQFYGVPQRRRRVFLVGHLGSWRGPAAVLFERESLSGHPPPSREEGQGPPSYTASSFGTYCEGVRPLRRSGGGIGGGSETLVPCSIHDRQDTSWAVVFNSKQDGGDAGDPAPTLRAMNNRNSSVNGGGQLAVAYQCHGSNVGEMGTLKGSSVTQGIPFVPHAFEPDASAHQSMNPSPVAAPLKTTQRPAFFDGMKVRRLMPIECERLQGFPDRYTARGVDEDGGEVEISDTQRYKMLGNSKAVPVVRWLGKRIEMVNEMMKEIAEAA